MARFGYIVHSVNGGATVRNERNIRGASIGQTRRHLRKNYCGGAAAAVISSRPSSSTSAGFPLIINLSLPFRDGHRLFNHRRLPRRNSVCCRSRFGEIIVRWSVSIAGGTWALSLWPRVRGRLGVLHSAAGYLLEGIVLITSRLGHFKCSLAGPAAEGGGSPRSIFVLRNNDLGDVLTTTPFSGACDVRSGSANYRRRW